MTETLRRLFARPRPLSVAAAEPRHLDAIHGIETECFSEPWCRDSLLGNITAKDRLCLVAALGGEIVGYASMLVVPDEGHILNIAVAERARRRGAGRLLLARLMEDGAPLGALDFTLEVRSRNRAAIALYESMGFERCGARKGYYRSPVDDALVMWKRRPPGFAPELH